MRSYRKLVGSNSLMGFSVHASNGPLGRVDDLYFDDVSWRVRHVVVDLGRWLPGRRVLLGAGSMGRADLAQGTIQARTSRRLLRSAPDAGTALPVALQVEREIVRAIAAAPRLPEAWLALPDFAPAHPPGETPADDQHLRSTSILKGCSIIDGGGERLGAVDDFMVDSETWEIRYVLLKDPAGRIFLVPSGDVAEIDAPRRKIAVRRLGGGTGWLEYGPRQAALLEPHQCLVCGE